MPVASASSISPLTPLPVAGAASLLTPVRVPLPGNTPNPEPLPVATTSRSSERSPARRYLARWPIRLTPVQERAIVDLAETRSLRAIAADVGVLPEAVRLLLKRSRFGVADEGAE
jgi:hypothetical protein